MENNGLGSLEIQELEQEITDSNTRISKETRYRENVQRVLDAKRASKLRQDGVETQSTSA